VLRSFDRDAVPDGIEAWLALVQDPARDVVPGSRRGLRVLQVPRRPICAGVFGSWLSLTIVIVCDSPEGLAPYSKVSIEPDL